jgi:NADPH-dependent glutamate synthase beta subunit-like oxidoreductase
VGLLLMPQPKICNSPHVMSSQISTARLLSPILPATTSTMAKTRQRVAIVGSGLAGLVSANLLSSDGRQRYAVKVFESVWTPEPLGLPAQNGTDK